VVESVIPSEERDPPQHFTKTHNHKEKRAYVLFIKDILWNKEWDPSSSAPLRSGWHIKEMMFGGQCLKTSSRAKRGIPLNISPKHTITNQTMFPFLSFPTPIGNPESTKQNSDLNPGSPIKLRMIFQELRIKI